MTDRASHPDCDARNNSRGGSLIYWLVVAGLVQVVAIGVGAYVHGNYAELRAYHCRWAGLSAQFPYEEYPLEHVKAKGADNWCAALAIINTNYELMMDVMRRPSTLMLRRPSLTEAAKNLEYARDQRLASQRWAKVRGQR